MSYRGEQKNADGTKIYVYEATSYWNSAKKRAEQKRVYIGTKDIETGEFKPNEKYYIIHPEEVAGNADMEIPEGFRIAKALDYGHVFLIRQVAEQLGIIDRMKADYGDAWENKLSLVIYKTLGYEKLAGSILWSETVYGTPELSERQYKLQKKDFEKTCTELAESIRVEIAARLDNSGLSKAYSFDSLMMELAKIKLIIFTIGRKSVTELTDMQKAIFTELGVDAGKLIE